MSDALIAPIKQFLRVETPTAWLDRAIANQETLLIDHANCEKKAASTALNLLYRYVEHHDLLNKLSRLAREELRHFEQVIAIMRRREIAYRQLTAARYASGLREGARTSEPGRLIDTLLIGAIIEARSCERFAALAPRLDEELSDFYQSLLRSEARHYQDYLVLARKLGNGEDIDTRLDHFLDLEAGLITSTDTQFRFHSGVPGLES